MKTIILFGSASLACGLVFVNLYNSMVDVRSWGSYIPHSITVAREYFRNVNPGNFFRIFSPVNQAFALIALIVFWKVSPAIRIFLGAALVLYVLGDVLTFAYFYPRNDIMLSSVNETNADVLTKIWSEWKAMNWVRTGIILAGLICTFLSLHKIYSLEMK